MNQEEGDTAEMMLALSDLCEYFCSTGLSVSVGVCVCVSTFLNTVSRNPTLMFSTHLLMTVWFKPASNTQSNL